jgi:hypothetical protein
LSEQPPDGLRDIAADGTQRDAEEGTPGGRSSRGPSLSVGGEQEPGGAVPPYEGRQTSAPVDTDGSDYRDGVRVGGATGPVESSRSSPWPDPEDTPRGATATPADERPAKDEPAADERDGTDSRDDPGVGPAHEPGTLRGEDAGD